MGTSNIHLRETWRQRILLLLFGMVVLSSGVCRGQVTGADLPATDTTIIFRPVRPLLEDVTNHAVAYNNAGMSLLFSSSGWAVGGYYGTEIGTGVTLNVDLFITGRRNTDEFENAIFNNSFLVVSEKVNRLLMIPLTASIQYRLFRESLQETFRPYFSIGAVAATIIRTPYLDYGNYGEVLRFYEYFESFGYATTYVRPGAMLGFGAVFGPVGKGNQVGVGLRYYTIPFGGDGLESIRFNPIKDFGGLIISMTIGSAW
ncbi:MAG: hypothetical protein FGM32_01510 [Candidatus Kapabacteria bacterium]|nr:hypothetical protein [Candidatus Kapabacteria bacterium]